MAAAEHGGGEGCAGSVMDTWYNCDVDGSQVFLFAGQIAAILLTLGSIDKNPAEQSGGYLIGGMRIWKIV